MPLQATAALQHVVLVWFQEPLSQEDIDTFIAAGLELKQIPQVQDVSVGTAMSSTRAIVDDSFDIGMVIILNSKQDMDAYLADKRHVHFVSSFIKGKTKKIVIYDF